MVLPLNSVAAHLAVCSWQLFSSSLLLRTFVVKGSAFLLTARVIGSSASLCLAKQRAVMAIVSLLRPPLEVFVVLMAWGHLCLGHLHFCG